MTEKYFPYFRGKQFELSTIRETAQLLSDAKFVPLVEPVNEALSGLERTLNAVRDAGGRAVVVVNPQHGELSPDGRGIAALLQQPSYEKARVEAGILLKGSMTVDEAFDCCQVHFDRATTLVHAGFTEAKALAERLGRDAARLTHVFLEPACGKLYRQHFKGGPRILLRDGFQRRRNRDHPPLERFSDLHATFREEGMDGFGDFLIVGDEFLEAGGPAYAVAIHLTFIDHEKDDEMFIHHFVSDGQDTPTDPAGKFAEALEKMIRQLDQSGSQVLESQAIQEFRELHSNGHFPGLGYVKKLSMKHHIETLADYYAHR
jgi:hypothetical protein